ncbi:uncharacterized protein EV154DRAFT_487753 [Mucor mucedo]|uniref:uncharacterized protein n=1 Tax=Mucor mucedo TaxID=29922 RepID=UPI00222049A0|nr:uncharacterized protein EV154DRAFT_487753 [Mucor mucedo]KAI7870887.1 hypothetical protein EV154DRAFT_487753 [Mucor mucedo]
MIIKECRSGKQGFGDQIYRDRLLVILSLGHLWGSSKAEVQKKRVLNGFYKDKGKRRYIIWNRDVRQDTIVMFDSDMCDRRQRTGNRWNRWNRDNGLVGFQ